MTIFEVYAFSQWNFASSIGQFFGSAVTYTSQKSEDFPLACLFEVFTGLWLPTPTFCMYDYVKRFVRVLVLLVINTGCLKKLLKMGNTILLISSSNYAKRQLNVCSGGDLCSPFFSNISETPCMKIGFDVRISRLMNEGRFPTGGRFHFLLPSQTLPQLAENSLLVIQKAKLLNMNS